MLRRRRQRFATGFPRPGKAISAAIYGISIIDPARRRWTSHDCRPATMDGYQGNRT